MSLRRDSAGRLLPPLVRAEGLLTGGGFAAALHDGFPVRFRFRLELRRNARSWFDALEREASWEVVVVRDPMTGEYDLVRSEGAVEHHEGERSVDRALATPFAVDILPSRGDARYYYLATLEMESLSLSELDEVERWLRGEFGAAIRERGDVGEALGHGARRLLLRISGLPRRTLEARTGLFTP